MLASRRSPWSRSCWSAPAAINLLDFEERAHEGRGESRSESARGLLHRERAGGRQGPEPHPRPTVRPRQRLGRRAAKGRHRERLPGVAPWEEYGEWHLGLTECDHETTPRRGTPSSTATSAPAPHRAHRLPLPGRRVAPQGDRAGRARAYCSSLNGTSDLIANWVPELKETPPCGLGVATRPDSVEGDHPSRPPVSRRLVRRTRLLGGPPGRSLFALHRTGFGSRRVTTTLVGSYPTFSPLPPASPEKFRRWRSPFCATFRRLSPPGVSPASCPSVSGLSSSRSRGPRSPGLHVQV